MVRIKVVLQHLSVKENDIWTQATRKSFFTCPIIKLWKSFYWVGISCWGEGIKLELDSKPWVRKKKSFCKFSDSLARKHLN